MPASKLHIGKLFRCIFLVGILLLFYCAYQDSLIDGIQEISHISAGTICALLGASTGYMLLEGLIVWLTAGADSPTINIIDGICCAFHCSFVRLLTFGSGGGVGEVWFLGKKGIDPAKATGMSMLQYLIQKAAVALLGIAAYILYFLRQDNSNSYYTPYILFAAFITVGIGTALALILFSQTFRTVLLRLLHMICSQFPCLQKKEQLFHRQVENLQLGSRLLARKHWRIVGILILNFGKYFCWFSTPYILYGSGEEISPGISISLMALATMLAGAIPAPGGYGSIEFMLLLLFSPILSKGQVLSLSILYRFVTSFFPFFTGAVLAAIRNRILILQERSKNDT